MKVNFFWDAYVDSIMKWAVGDNVASMKNAGYDSDHFWTGYFKRNIADMNIIYRPIRNHCDSVSAHGKRDSFWGLCIDDLIWDKTKKSPFYSEYFNRMDFFVFSTEFLASQSEVKDKPVIIKGTSISQKNFDLLSSTKRKKKRNDDKLHIGVTKGHQTPEFVSFMNKVMTEIANYGLKDSVVFHIFGDVKYVFDDIVRHKETRNVDDFHSYLANECSFDLVLNPSEINDFTNSKCYPKYLECGAMGVPLITSRTFPFKRVVKEYENGLFADTPSEYVSKIVFALKHKSLVLSMSKRAFLDVQDNFISENTIHDFFNDLEDVHFELLKRGSSLVPKKSRKSEATKDKSVSSNGKKKEARKVYVQESCGRVSFNLVGSKSLKTFVKHPVGYFEKVSFKGVTYKQVPDGVLKLVISLENGENVWSSSIKGSGLVDNSWWSFDTGGIDAKGSSLNFNLEYFGRKTIGFYQCDFDNGGYCWVGNQRKKPIAILIE